MKIYEKCQSCGMPMKSEELRGSESNGTKSLMYCTHCYVSGKFVHPDITVEGMQQLCIEKMIEMKTPKIMAKLFSLSIPKLVRWNKL